MNVVTFPIQPIQPAIPHEASARAIHGLDLALSAVIDVIQQTTDHEELIWLHRQLLPLIETACRVQAMCVNRIEADSQESQR